MKRNGNNVKLIITILSGFMAMLWKKAHESPIAAHILKMEIDAEIKAGNWWRVEEACRNSRFPEGAKYGIDKAVENGKWLLIAHIAEEDVDSEVRDYAREQFKKLKKSDIDTIIKNLGNPENIENSDPSLLDAILKFSPKEIVEYSVDKVIEGEEYVGIICIGTCSPKKAAEYAVKKAVDKGWWEAVGYIADQEESSARDYAREQFKKLRESDIDAIIKSEIGIIIEYFCKFCVCEVVKYILDKAVEKKDWSLVGRVMDLTPYEDVKECAQRQFKQLKKIHVDKAIESSDWVFVERICRTGSKEVAEYAIAKSKEAIDDAVAKGDWDSVNYAGVVFRRGKSETVAKYAVDRAATEGNWTVVKEFVIFGSEIISNYAAKKLEDAGIAHYTLPQVDE